MKKSALPTICLLSVIVWSVAMAADEGPDQHPRNCKDSLLYTAIQRYAVKA